MVQMVKKLPAMWETFRSLGWKDPLEKGLATHSSILAWKTPWTVEPGKLQSVGSQRVRHDWAANTHTHTHTHTCATWLCKIVDEGSVWGQAARHSKASKQTRLVEKKVCFISDAGNWGGRRWQTSVQRPAPQPWQTRGECFYRQSCGVGGWLHTETTQSSTTVIFKLIISGLTSIIFVVLGTVNLQFQGHLFPLLCDQFSDLQQLLSWVQSGYHVVNFSTCCFGIGKTTHKIWLRVLSILRKN